MQNFLLKIFIIFLLLSGNVQAQTCSWTEQIKYPDGTVSCLGELPFAKEIVKEENKTIYDYVSAATPNVIAISKYKDCKAIGVAAQRSRATFGMGPHIRQTLTKVALDRCMNQGCDCEIVIVDSVSKVNKLSLLSMLGNSDDQKVAVTKPPQVISQSVSSSTQTALCKPQQHIKFSDGSTDCMPNISFFNQSFDNTKSAMISFADEKGKIAVAFSKDFKTCPLAIINWAPTSPWALETCNRRIKQRAIDEKINPDNCQCEILIENGQTKLSKQEFGQKTNEYLAVRGGGLIATNIPKEQLVSLTDNSNDQKVVVTKIPPKEIVSPERKVKEDLTVTNITNEQLATLRRDLEKEIRDRILAEAALKSQKESSTAPAKVYANRKALVIGNDTYQKVSQLSNAREDARLMAENLIQFGFKVQLKLNVTEKQFKSELRNFKNSIQPGDEVAIFYAGHGVQIASTNYLLPVDIAGQNEEEIKDEAVPLQRILDDMNEKGAKFTLAMIDACRDNPFKGSTRNVGSTRGLAPTTAATGQMIVFSAGSGQQALDQLGPTDKNKNGLFTRVFVEEMQKSGVTVDRVVRNARSKVVEMAKSVGHNQVPAIYDQVVGEFYFRQ